MYRFLLCGLLWLTAGGLYGQAVYLSEATATNTTHYDADDDLSDWLELHNPGPTPVDLTGWSLTDDPAVPRKYRLEGGVLGADDYLQLWASGKDRGLRYPDALLTPEDAVHYAVYDTTVDRYAWTGVDYDDRDWASGPTPLGYGLPGLGTTLPTTVQAVVLRYPFRLESVATVRELLLHLDYDDGFVAYLNGVEVARADIWGDRPDPTTGAARDAAARLPQGLPPPPVFRIADYAELLREGDNVLALQVHNRESDPTTLLAAPHLTAFTERGGRPPAAALHLGVRPPHTNFRLSAGGETVYLYDPAGRLVDQLTLGDTPAGTSTGRTAAGPEAATVYFATPTPGRANGEGVAALTEQTVRFSRAGGPVEPFTLILSGAGPGAVIRYTLDATVPDTSSAVYRGPLPIDRTTVLRAAVFAPGRLPGPVASQTYLVGTSHRLPTLSLVADPDDLFSDARGIYVLGPGTHGGYPYFGANIWREWERPVVVSFREADGMGGTDFRAGVKVFGGFSRGLPQRSLSLFARGAYGDRQIDYPLFADRPYEEFESVVLRNSGNDWMNTMLRDGLVATLYADADLETLGYRPAATYLNGRYWGLYNLREKVNEHYLASRSGYAPDEINLLELGGDVIHGQRAGYHELIRYVQRGLKTDTAYYRFASEVDVENFILYHVVQLYLNNTDWPANNYKYWRPDGDGGRWRWILFDTDLGFGLMDRNDYRTNSLRRVLEETAPGWRYQSHTATFLRAAIEHEGFRNRLVNRFADELNERLLPERVEEQLDRLAATIAPELPAHFARWDQPFYRWRSGLDRIRVFAAGRPAVVREDLLNYFGLPGMYPVRIANEQPEAGYVLLNSLRINEADWSGTYFADVPVDLTAVARPGYTFRYWTGDVYFTQPSITVNPNQALTIRPVFAPTAATAARAVINEVHYASDPTADAGDWIELHNPGSEPLDLSGWILKDNVDAHEYFIPDGTELPPGGYLVVAQDRPRYAIIHPDHAQVIGDFDFGLSNEADAVRLYNADYRLMDVVRYTDTGPWPTAFDGDDRTIALTDPEADNNEGTAWVADNFGTPRNPNLSRPAAPFDGPLNPAELAVRPNPTFGSTTVRVSVPRATAAELAVFDLMGRRLTTLYTGRLQGGATFLDLDLSELPLGVYLLRLTNGDALPPVTLRLMRQ